MAARYERTAGLRAEALKADRSFDGDYWRGGHRPTNDFSMKALAAPSNGSFLANPISEMESRHRFLEAEYRSYMQRPKSRTPEPPREAYASEQVKSKQRRKEVLQEPKEEVYFPFGKPGGGAPLRDPKTRFLEDIPSPQPPAKDRYRRGEPSPAKIVSGLTAQDRESKHRQQEEVRRLLDEQLGQRRRRLEEEKRARLAEDQLEEARLERQRREMEEEYRRELRSREGLPDPPAAVQKPTKPRPQAPLQPPEERREERPPEPEVRRYLPAPFVHEEKVQRLRDEMAGRQQGLQELIMRLKEESAGLSAKHYDAVREFELLREDLRAKKAQNDSIFQIPHNPGIGTVQWREPARPRIQHESRFLPISQAGLSVVSDRSPVPVSLPPPAVPSYSDIESAEISHQLSKLDSILDYCRAPLSTVD